MLSGAYRNAQTRIIVQKYSPATNSFSVMGVTTFDNSILAQIIVNSVLYVAGSFNDPCSKIAKWNGSDWDCLSSQTISDSIVTLSSNSDESAILVGNFEHFEQNNINNISKNTKSQVEVFSRLLVPSFKQLDRETIILIAQFQILEI